MKVLIVFDVYGWAWHRMSQGIKKYAPSEFDVDICSQLEFNEFSNDKIRLSEYDGISQCSWAESSTNLPYDGKKTAWVASHFNHDFPVIDNDFIPSRIATRIRNIRRSSAMFRRFDSLLCVSDNLHELALRFNGNAVRVVPGIDPDVFYPTESENRRFSVGWCAQKNGVTKGYHEVLEPLMELDIGVQWVVNTLDHTASLSADEMRDWYNSIDIYLSTSCSEGFQMTIPEAMACNKPVIATVCGAVKECVKDGLTGCVVDAYSDMDGAAIAVNDIEAAIKSVRDFGDNPREYALNVFNWKERSEEWLRAMV